MKKRPFFRTNGRESEAAALTRLPWDVHASDGVEDTPVEAAVPAGGEVQSGTAISQILISSLRLGTKLCAVAACAVRRPRWPACLLTRPTLRSPPCCTADRDGRPGRGGGISLPSKARPAGRPRGGRGPLPTRLHSTFEWRRHCEVFKVVPCDVDFRPF